MKKHLCLILCVALLLGCLGMQVYAHEVPDLAQNGTVTFTIQYDGTPLSGGTITLYRVGDITENNGDYSFCLIASLQANDISLADVTDPALAKTLAALAKEKKLSGITAPIANGKVVFTDVTPGLYVAIQEKAIPGYEAMAPFLISMPQMRDGVYHSNVEAFPKVPLETAPTEPTKPNKPDEPKLPQTGQLNWPIPVLAVSGLALFLIGWLLCFGKRKESYEE